MFHVKRVLGLACLTTAFALSGCGGDDANKDPLLVCDNGDVIQNGQCVTRPPACPSGFELNPDSGECEIAGFGGPDPAYFPAENEAVVYYNRQHVDGDYSRVNVYRWQGCAGNDPDWSDIPGFDNAFPGPVIEPNGVDPVYGAYYVFPIVPDTQCGNVILSIGGNANQSPDLQVDFFRTTSEGVRLPPNEFDRMKFFIAGNTGSNSAGFEVSNVNPVCLDPAEGSDDVCGVAAVPARVIRDVAAHWIDTETLVWVGAGSDLTEVELYASSEGGLDQDANGAITLNDSPAAPLAMLSSTTLSAAQAERFPHLAGDNAAAFSVSGVSADMAKELVKGQLIATAASGERLIGTSVQISRLLDALYTEGESDADEGTFGVQYGDGTISVSVWAPTARAVRIKLFGSANDDGSRLLNSEENMTLDSATGIWSFSGPTTLDGSFYLFEVERYDAAADAVVLSDTTDPYSVSVSVDSLYSQFIDIDSAATKPEGWDDHAVPTVDRPEDIVIYEGHVRDFSVRDESTSEANRGKFLAFTETDSVPMQHLQDLQAAGLTHFHFLPAFDISSVIEDSEFQINLNDSMATLCALSAASDITDLCSSAGNATILSVLTDLDPATDDSRRLMLALKKFDGFNWGYDPWHFNVPEGSYSSDPEGPARIAEMRAMIKSLHDIGLRVVMDVVYNHTTASGDDIKSTFDKIVPGYYYRLDPVTGEVEGASCCEDTAAENRMFAKFMVDSTVLWADAYKVDSFRFDLMTLHPRPVMEEILAAVQVVDPDTYIYGEGWRSLFGEGSTANDGIFVRATQPNMAGTGIGTFNDVLRDAARSAGLVNGDGNNGDRIRLGLAGNLADFEFYSSAGSLISGSDIGGYTADPQENVVYVSKHDNETLWDFLASRAGLNDALTLEQRVRIQNLTLSMPLLSQGVPFIHMGSDLLRSKSLDRNTFDSGDWYNYVDFTQQTNNWNVGQPIELQDGVDAVAISAREELNAAATDIQFAADVFRDYLALSGTTPLFSLETADDVNARIGFHNQGVLSNKNVLVMSIDDGDTPASLFESVDAVELEEDVDLADLDPSHDAVVIVINGATEAVEMEVFTAQGFELHPMLAMGTDTVVRESSFAYDADSDTGTFSVPALTTAVFVKPQSGEQGYGLYAGASPAPGGVIPNPFGEGTQMFLRGSLNDWGLGNPASYDYRGNFTAFATLDTAAMDDPTTVNFKFATEDWSVQFTDDVSLTGEDGTPTVEFGVDSVLEDGDGKGDTIVAFPLSMTSPVEYRFNLDALIPNAPVLNVAPAQSYGDDAIYLRGLFDDWGTLEYELEYAERSVYSTTVTVDGVVGDDPLVSQFKVANQNFDNDIDFGIASGAAPINALGSSTELNNLPDTRGNIPVSFPVNGEYLFRLDARVPGKPVLQIRRIDVPLFVRGANSDWGTTNQMTFDGDSVYTGEVAIVESNTRIFKIADEGWSDGLNFGVATADTEISIDTPAVLQNQGADIVFPFATSNAMDPDDAANSDEDGNYRFTLDFTSGQPVLTLENIDG